MNSDQLDQLDVSKPFLNEVQFQEDLQQNRLRGKEMLDHFATDSIVSMDGLTLALNEGRKDDALKELEILLQLSREIRADTLAVVIESLRLAVSEDEATEVIQTKVAKLQTAFQGTLALVKQLVITTP